MTLKGHICTPEIRFVYQVSVCYALYHLKLKPVLAISDLRDIPLLCDSLVNGIVYRAIFLLACFGFFRLSNLVPQSQIAF